MGTRIIENIIHKIINNHIILKILFTVLIFSHNYALTKNWNCEKKTFITWQRILTENPD